MKLLIIEQPLGNRGDESAHRGLINKLIEGYPYAQITILFYGVKESSIDEFRVLSPNVEYVNIPIVSRRIFSIDRMIKAAQMFKLPYAMYLYPFMRKVLKFYKQADYVLCAPGGINLGGFQDWRHVAFLYMAKLEKKKVIYFARSIGPFKENRCRDRRFNKLSKELLSYFSFISLRDYYSQAIADDWGVKAVKTIDSAFLHYTKVNIPMSFQEQIQGHDYMVLVPNSLAWHHDFKKYSFDDFFKFWVKLTNALLMAYPQYKIAMLPQTIGHSKFLPDGYKYFCQIKQACLAPQRIVVLNEKYGSDIQQAIIADAKFLIGARYHSVVFAINQATAFVSLSYEHKMSGVVAILGKENSEVVLQNIFNDAPDDKKQEIAINHIIELTRSLKSDKAAQQQARLVADAGFDELKQYFTTNKKLFQFYP